jgi:hypothetical protein
MIEIKILERLLLDGKIDMIGINLEQIEELIKEERKKQEEEFLSFMKVSYTPPSFSIDFHHDWDSLMFWQPMNWRNFTLIKIDGETNGYSKYLELEIVLLGFHLEINWYRGSGEKDDTGN